jgi:hypothetical protein
VATLPKLALNFWDQLILLPQLPEQHAPPGLPHLFLSFVVAMLGTELRLGKDSTYRAVAKVHTALDNKGKPETYKSKDNRGY